jgi:hypothetical protein
LMYGLIDIPDLTKLVVKYFKAEFRSDLVRIKYSFKIIYAWPY